MPSDIAIRLRASERRWPVQAARAAARPEPTISGLPAIGLGGKILGCLEDAVLLLLVAFMVPVVILVVGTPVALFVRLLIEIARRW